MADSLLTLNAGSSSLKFVLFGLSGALPARSCQGEVEGIGDRPHFAVRDASGAVLAERRWPSDTAPDHEVLLAYLLDWVDAHLGVSRLIACGHRVVHGGADHVAPERVTAKLLTELEGLTPLAPLHQGHSLAAIRAVQTARPGLDQVACYDTAFHHELEPVVRRFALPRHWEDVGVRRYGFHGLSYEHIAERLGVLSPRLAAGRTIAAHLGNGASLCALKAGRSVDTTMGMTPLDGLVMGTRCGAIDPGVVIYLMRQHGLDAAEVEDLLYHGSGLLGVSGISNDVRTLLNSNEPAAREALELFAFHVARQTGALSATLGGIDGFVFTGGIGEHAAAIRAAICNRLTWLGVVLDESANRAGNGRISAVDSAAEVWVIPADEEAVIARHTIATLGLAGQH